jgi:hypothetical protein
MMAVVDVQEIYGELLDIEISIISCFLLLCDPELLPSYFFIHRLKNNREINLIAEG